MELIGILLILTGVMTVAVITLIAMIGRSQKQRYYQDMIFLEKCLKNWVITKQNYYTLGEMFDNIYRNDYDRERTHRAWKIFMNKYSSFFPAPKIRTAEKVAEVIHEN